MPSIETGIADFLNGQADAESITREYDPHHIGHWLARSGGLPGLLVTKLYEIGDYYIAGRKFAEGLALVGAFLGELGQDDKVRGDTLLLGSEMFAYCGRYKEGLEHLENARTIFSGLNDNAKLLQIHSNAAGFHTRLGNFGNARDESESGLELAEREGNTRWQMRLWNNLGLALKNLGDDLGAIDAYRKSVELAKNFSSEPKSRMVIAGSLVNIGNIYTRIGRIDQAEEFMKRAMDEWNSLGDKREVARCLNNLGHILIENDPERSAEYLTEALSLAVEGGYTDVESKAHFNMGRILRDQGALLDAEKEFLLSRANSEALGDEEYIWRTGMELGRIALTQGNATLARELLAYAAEKLTSGRKKLRSEGDRINFLADREELFSWLVRSATALGKPLTALVDIQKVQGLALYELMTGDDAKPIDEDRLQGIVAELKAKGIGVLDYFIAGEKLIAGMYSPSGIELRETAFSEKDYTESYEKLLDKIKAYEISTELRANPLRRDAAFDAELEKLYGMIIKPFEDILNGIMHLVIIPHGILGSLPFQALRDGGKYLVERYPISFYPNLTAMLMVLSKRKLDLSGAKLALIKGSSGGLGGLDDEESRVHESFPGTVEVVHGGMMESLGGSDADWLHYTGHASFRSGDAPEPVIEIDDGRRVPFLKPGEKAPPVVVLSACQTALGEARGASETMGIARTMFASGGQALIATLWQVADRETSELMGDMYSKLKDSGGLADALAGAQGGAINRGWHPYFWAPFRCSGDVWFE